ncbi:MAG: lipid-binding SYLF domain-containing protein [Candidatus Hydrogenedentota bacterium]
MKRLILFFVLAIFVFSLQSVSAKEEGTAKGNKIIGKATSIIDEVMKDPESRIPKSIFQKCEAIAVFPNVLKASFIFGGQFGEGLIIAKDDAGNWKSPLFFTMSGGSFGFQIGAKSMDIIFFFMTKDGIKALLNEKTTLGMDLAVAIGEVGDVRDADIDLLLQAEIISYAKAKGLFAGISVKGCAITYAEKFSQSYYDQEISKRDVLLGESNLKNPKKVKDLIKTLDKYSK